MGFDVRAYQEEKRGKRNAEQGEGLGFGVNGFDVRTYEAIKRGYPLPGTEENKVDIPKRQPVKMQPQTIADKHAQARSNYAAKRAAGLIKPVSSDRLSSVYADSMRNGDLRKELDAIPMNQRRLNNSTPTPEYEAAYNRFLAAKSAQRTELETLRAKELEAQLTALQNQGKAARDHYTRMPASSMGGAALGVEDARAQATERKLVRLENEQNRAAELAQLMEARKDAEYKKYETPAPKPEDPYARIGGVRAFGGSDQVPVDLTPYMTAEEAKTHGYLAHRDGDEAADRYLSLIRNDLESRYTDEEVKKATEYAEAHPVIGSIRSVGENIPKAISGTAYTIGQAIKNENINPRAMAYAPELRQSAARETVSKDMGQFGSFLYDTGMSMADFLSLAPLGSTGAAAVLGTGAFQSTAREASEKGADLDQAVMLGAVAGAAEIITEKIGMDRLFNIFDSATKTGARAIILEMVKNGFPEASEEIITEIVNTVADVAVRGAQSDWVSQYDELIRSGVSPTEARKSVLQAITKNVLVAGAGGFLSGAVMAGGSASLGNLASNVDAGMRIRENGTLADRMRAAVDAGVISEEKASAILKQSEAAGDGLKGIAADYRAGRISNQMTQRSNDATMNAVRADVQRVVSESNAAAAVSAMKDVIYHHRLSNAGAQLVANDPAVRRVFSAVLGIDVPDGTDTALLKTFAALGSTENYVSVPDVAPSTPTQAEDAVETAPEQTVNAAPSMYNAATPAADPVEHDTSAPDIAVENIETATPEAELKDYYAKSRRHAEQQQAAIDAAHGKGPTRFGMLNRVEMQNGSRVKVGNYSGTLTPDQKAAIRVLNNLAAASSVNIEVHDTFAQQGQALDETPNGYYDRATNTLHIALDAENNIVVVAAHELTHFIQQWSPVQYENLKDFLREYYNAQQAGQFDLLVRKKMGELQVAGREGVTYAIAEDEVIADASQMFLSDGDAIGRLAAKNKTLGGKIADFIRQLLKDLYKAMNGVQASSDEAILLQENIAAFEKAQELWTKALEEAAEAYRYTGGLDVNAAGTPQRAYMIRQAKDGTRYVVIDLSDEEQQKFNGLSVGEAAKAARTFIKKHFQGTVIGSEENRAYVDGNSANEYAYPANRRMDPDIKLAKMRASTELNDLIAVSTFLKHESDRGYHADAVNGWDYYMTIFQVGKGNFIGKVCIKNTKRGRVFYDIAELTKVKDITSRTSAQYAFAQGTSADDVSMDNIPYAESGVNDSGKRNGTSSAADTRQSTRTRSASNRELLADALLQTAASPDEEQRIKDYRLAAKRLDEYQAQLKEARTQLREMMFAPDDRHRDGTYERKLETAKERVAMLERKIDRYDKRLLSLESTKPLRDLMTRERAKAARRVTEKARTDMKEYKAEQEKRKYRARIERNANSLATWLTRPTDSRHVPEALRAKTAEFLQTLDFSHNPDTITAAAWGSTLQRVVDFMEQVNKKSSEDKGYGYFDIDPGIGNMLDSFLSLAGERNSIGEMNAEQLKAMSRLLDILKKSITESNKLKANAKFEEVSELGDTSIRELRSHAEKRLSSQKLVRALDKLLNISMLDSFAYFEELGPAAYSVLGGLRKGWDKRVRHIEQAMHYMSDALKDTDIRKWSGANAQAATYEVEGGEIKLTVAQVMELYELSKRAQAHEHLFEGGIKTPDMIAKEGKKKVSTKKTDPVAISEEDVKRITDTLTPRQKEVADAMQAFMEKEAAAWGNETSMSLYGYLKFVTKNYWPISSDDNSNNTIKPESHIGLYAAKNFGATKQTQENANNAIVINDAFTTFTRHIDQMATYGGLVVPMSDAMKWYNYRVGKSSSYSVKQGIDRLMGEDGKKYFTTLMEDLNGVSKAADDMGFAAFLTGNAKVAAVSFNPRVVLQQPTAYLRAAAVIDPKYLAKGKCSKAAMERMHKHSSVALWKSWGFFDTNLGVTMRDLIVGDKSTADKIREAGLWAAGKADDITWAALWSATEAEIKDKRPELKADSDEYFEAVSDRFSEIVDRTQVVDTIFHKSQFMRSKDFLAKDLTSFMAEPTKTYNMLRSATVKVAREKTRESKLRFARVATVYIATGITTAAAASIADAFRDDEDEDKEGNKRSWLTKYKEALLGNAIENLNPLSLIPIFNDILSIMNGYSQTSLMFSGLENVFNAILRAQKYGAGSSQYTFYGVFSNLVKSVSKVVGIPAGNLLRTFESLYNTIAPENIAMKKSQLKK